MIARIRRLAVPGVLLTVLLSAAQPATAAETGPFPFTAPKPGTVLVYSDGFEVAFGSTKGRVTKARAGPKSAPRAARMEIEDAFLIRWIQRGTRVLAIKNTVEAPGFWPLVPGATRRYRMDVSVDGKLRQSQKAVARIGKTATTLDLAGKPRRVIQIDIDVRWKSSKGKPGRVDITYWHDLDLGYYVKRSYTRYGPDGLPRTPKIRTLVRVGHGPRKTR